MTTCDECDRPPEFRVYASYNRDQGENAHPLHARYPGVQFRACAEHLAELIRRDSSAQFSTRQWIVVRPTDRYPSVTDDDGEP